MGVEIRKPDPTATHSISLTKAGWLRILEITTELGDSASSEVLDESIAAMSKAARGFVLSREKVAEHTLTLEREAVLNLYLFFAEFHPSWSANSDQVTQVVFNGMREYLLGGQA